MAATQPTVQRFKLLFWESMSEAVQDSARSPYHALIEANGLIVRGKEEQEQFYSSQGNLHDFFATHLPDLVSFEPNKLREWARDAISFAEKNSTHNSFVELFSTSMHYEVVLTDALDIDISTSRLKTYLSRTLSLKGVFVSDTYPAEVQRLIWNLAEQALIPTLRLLAVDLKNEQRAPSVHRLNAEHQVKRVEKDPSFRDLRGAIRFDWQNDRLRIAGVRLEPKASNYRPAVERALRNMQEETFLQRAHNRDPRLVRLINEYKEKLEEESGSAAIELWYIGVDIDSRRKSHQNRLEADDALDADDLSTIDGFLLAHGLYIQCFDSIETLGVDLDRTTQLFKGLKNVQALTSWGLLDELGKAGDIVEKSSGELMQKASSDLRAGIETRGTVAIGLGLLRGCLHAVGSQLLNLLSSTVVRVASTIGSAAMLAELKKEHLYGPTVAFVQSSTADLIRLSLEMPNYFAWVGHLLSILGLS